MSEYHKIETAFERDKTTFKVIVDKLRNPVYGIIKSWLWTEKIDGTNTRIIWKDRKLSFGGKTDNAQLPGDLIAHLHDTFYPNKIEEVFPDCPAIIYGEGCGAGIQKGGGNYSSTKQFIVFDVLVDGIWWLNWENTKDVAFKLGLKTVPFLGEKSLREAVEIVRRGFNSPLAKEQTGADHPAEGMVGRTIEPLFDKKGHRLIIKLKTKDFK